MEQKKVLGIISAAKCNLNCSYCYLHKNQSYIEEDKKIIAAMQDGSFLTNIKRSLYALNESYNNFYRLEFWGAETSLHFIDGSDFFKDLILTFPSLEEIAYSTNFRTGNEQHLHLIDLIEQYAEHRILLEMQISVDGPTAISQKTRHYNYEDLEKDVIDFIDILNKKKLKKTKVVISYKSTLPWSLYHEICSSTSGLIDYLDFWSNTESMMWDNVINKNVAFSTGSCFGPALEYPYNYTIQDGLDFSAFAQKIDRLKLDERYNRPSNMPLLTSGFVKERELQIYEFSGFQCGQMNSNLLFRYDGTLSPCSNGFLDRSIDNLNWLKENDPSEYTRVLNTRKLGTITDENNQADLDDLINKVRHRKEFWKYHADTVVSITNSEMYELAMARQISPIYAKDSALRFKHSLFIVKKNACYFSNLRETGSPYTPPESLIKLYCNGLGEYHEFRR